MNFKLTLQYDGTDFHGWQMQGDLRTVQGELTRALSLIDGRDVTVHGSGRTDAGAHAEGQVANVKIERAISGEKLCAAINGNVEKDLRVLEAETVGDDFQARYSALGKTYVYRIVNGPVISPFWSRYALHESRHLDLKRMEKVAGLFPGKHDWTAFSAAQADVESRVRTITQLEIAQRKDEREQTSSKSSSAATASVHGSLNCGMLAVGRDEID